MDDKEKVKDINEKLLELYSKLVKIRDKLNTFEDNNVEAHPVNRFDKVKSAVVR